MMNLCELIFLQICGAVYCYNSWMASQVVACWRFAHGDQLFYLFKAVTKRHFHRMEQPRQGALCLRCRDMCSVTLSFSQAISGSG